MKTPFALLAVSAALLIATGAARADVVPSNSSIRFEAAIAPADMDWASPGRKLSLTQFDPLLGTLNAVSFQWRGVLNSNFSAYNAGDNPSLVRYVASGSMGFSLPLPATAQIVFGPQEGEFALASGQSLDVPVVLTGGGSGAFLGDLSDFIGEDIFDVRVVAQGDSSMNEESGNVDYNPSMTASAWVQVTYDYTARGNDVPEPGALSLLGLALAGAGIASRRRT